MGAAQHQSIDRRGTIGSGRLHERPDVGADDVADRRLDRRVALDRGGQGGGAELADRTVGDLGERFGIGVGGASAHGGQHGHPALCAFGGLGQALRARFDDTDHDDRQTPRLHRGADILQTVSGSGVAGDDDGLHRRLLTFGITSAKQKQDIAQDELAEEFGAPGGGIIPIRHVGLVSEIDETFAGEIRHAVRALLARAVIVTVMCLEGLEDRQTAHAGIEDADRQVTEVATVIRRDEAGRGIALRMRFRMTDRDGERIIRRTQDDREDAEQRETEKGSHRQVRSVR